MKTPAAILVEQHKPLVLDEVEVPSLNYGQVLVEIRSSRICGSQIGEIEGVKGPDRFLPHLLGHEGGGIVREIGPEVKQVKPGDRVVLHWRPGKGIECTPPVYLWKGKKVNAGWLTTFNHFAVVSENRLTPVPPDTDFDLCSLLADTITTGFGVINNDARLKIGESAVIIGCGGIGLGTLLGARLAGAHPIIAVDIHDCKIEKAMACGATHGIHAGRENFIQRVETILDGKADVVVDGTGNPAVLEKALSITAPTGRCIGVGVMPHDQSLSINTLPFHFGKQLKGSHGGDSQPAQDIPRYLRMIRDSRFHVDNFVSHRIALDQVNATIDQMKRGEVIHAMIQFG